MYVLTPLFGKYYQSKIIEVFLENYDEELSTPEIIEMAETSRGSTYKYLSYLVSEKIIKEIRKIGKTQLYKLNLNHPTTKILFQLEHERFTENIEKLVGKIPEQEKEFLEEPVITLLDKNGVTRKHYEDGSVETVSGLSKWKTSEIKKKKIEYNVADIWGRKYD